MGDNASPDNYTRKIAALEAKLAACQQQSARAAAASVVAHAPVAMAVLDQDLCYVAANVRWLDNHKLQGQDVLGVPHVQLFPDLPDSWHEAYRRCLAGETVSSEEDVWTRADGSRRWLRWSIYPWYDAEGAIAGLVIASQDISAQHHEQAARQEALEHLQEQQQYLQMMLDNLPIILFAIASDRRFTLGEGRGMRMLGLEPGQTVGMLVDDLYADNPQVLGYVNRALAGEAFMAESYLPDLDMYFENHYAPMYDRAGALCGTIGVAYDISERKRNQRKLERAQQLAKMGDFVFDVAKGSSSASPELFAIYGLPVSDSLDLEGIRTLLKPEEFARVEQAFALTLQTASKQALEYRITTPAGDVRDIYSTWEAITDGQGAVTQVFGTVQDISESKAIMRQLETKSQQLQAIISNLPVVLYMLDTQGVFTLSEGKGLEVLGLQPGQVNGQAFFELYADEVELLTRARRALAGEAQNFTIDVFGLSYDNYYTPWYDSHGQLSGMLGIAYDITAIKRAQHELEHAQRLAGTGSFTINLQDYSIRASANALVMHGFAPDAQITIIDLAPTMSSADFQYIQDSIAQTVHEKHSREIEYTLHLPDDIRRNITAKLNAMTDEQGRVYQVFGTVQDISERKRFEQVLREQQQLLEDAQRIGQLGAWSWDIASDTITWSEQTYATFQVPRDQPITWDFVTSLYVDVQPLEQAIQQALEQQQQYELELEVMTMQGERRWLRVIGTPITDNGQVVRLTGTQQDISDTKNAQLALQANNRHLAQLNRVSSQLKAAQDAATMLEAVLEPLQKPLAEGDSISASLLYVLSNEQNIPESLRIVAAQPNLPTFPIGSGIALSDFPSSRLWLSNPETVFVLDDVAQDPRLAASERQVFLELNAASLVVVPLFQAFQWVGVLLLSYPRVRHLSANERSYIEALPAMLTPPLANRRLLENLEETVSLRGKQLEESRRLLRATIDNASSAIFAKDLTGRYILANTRLAQFAATSAANVIGQYDDTLFAPDIATIMQRNDHQVIKQAQAMTFEEQLPTSEGVRIFSAIKFPLIDDDGQVFAVGGISTDVTEVRHKEAEMQAYRNQLAKAQTELQITQRIQALLLPDIEELRAIDTLDIASYMQPAEEVGGDYYDVLRIGEHVKIGIGDVTGHGLESGLLMLMTQAAVRTLFASAESDPKALMNILNRTVFDSLQRMHVDKSLTLALLDYHQGRLRFSGQHEYMLVMRAETVEVIDTMDLGMPLGLEEDISHFIAEQEVDLHPGDGVVLFTDGITEAENAQGEQFGLPRLIALAEQHRQASANAIVAAIIAAVDAHVAGGKVYDDVTLLVLKRPLLVAQHQPQRAVASLHV